MAYLTRAVEHRLGELLRAFPAVMLLGPRQCGKSTMIRHTLDDWTHVDLERPSDFSVLTSDPEGFFAANPRRLAIDEAQRWPELFSVLRHVIDRGKGKGRFVLLGSANPSLVRGVSESLAGRVATLELTGFTMRELSARRRAQRWFWGGYPPVFEHRTNVDRLAWLDAYVTAFVERDLPALGLRLSPVRLRTFWTMLTHVHGNLLNVSDLARSLSVSSHTVGDYLDVFESSFMLRRLPPFFANVQKRLTKSPKVYFRDTGLLHFLAGLRAPPELETWSRRGASFEGLVVEELAALAATQVVRPELYFWRTAAGAEVDLLIATGRELVPFEIKAGATVDARDLAGLRSCMTDLDIARGYVVYTGTERRALGHGIELLPWGEIADGTFTLG